MRLKGAEVSLAVARAVKLFPRLDNLPIVKLCAALEAGGLISAP